MRDLQPKHSLAEITARLTKLPSETRRIALEQVANMAGVSFRLARLFADRAPFIAERFPPAAFTAWADFGRKLAIIAPDAASNYFVSELPANFDKIPLGLLPKIFELASKQLILSSSNAVGSLSLIPEFVDSFEEKELDALLELAAAIADRSAQHSSNFLAETPRVAKALNAFGKERPLVFNSAIRLMHELTARAGGLSADLWAMLPTALEQLSPQQAVVLLDSASAFLRFGGSATLHFVNAASSVLRSSPEVFESWNRLACTLGDKRIATMLAFLRITPTIISRLLKSGKRSHEIDSILKTLLNIAETDSEAALAAFRSSSAALLRVSAEKFDQWASAALERLAGSGSKARRSYFALETRQSRRELEYGLGLYLEEIAPVLRVYIEGLTGRSVEIVSFASALRESRIGDGKTIALPSAIDEFDEVEENFRLFKVLAAYGAGQIEFGTFAKDTAELKKVYQNLSALYTASAEEKDAFSLAGYLEDISNAQRGLTESEIEQEFKKRARKLPPNSDYKEVLKVFPDPQLARRIFGLLENARIDFLLRRAYRGLRKDLDLMQKQLYRKRPSVFELPAEQVPFELLFQVTLCGGTSAETRAFYGQALSEIEAIIERYLKPSSENITPTVADTVYATSRIFELFDAITPQKAVSDDEVQDTETEDSEIQSYEEDTAAETDLKTDREQNKNDLREIFNAWNQVSNQPEPQNLDGAELWASSDVAEQSLEPGDEAFNYDEWDRELGDYRVGWSRVIERRARLGERDFVELVRSRYRGVISSIRRQFQLMKPENLSRVNRELDGEDYDLNSLVEHIVDRRADGRPSEAIYTKRLRKTRDVAVLILLDQSSSTARTITRNPLQPYTHPGRRIIEIEKEGLVLMSEALEAVGDSYAITGFTSEGRRNVKFYVVKDFHERYSSETARRIGGITFQNNTRLGAAIRHASRKLLRYQARTRLMIILTDGRPYDHDYGDARYAREDVREALTEAKINGITPFCITIDRESETELKDLYGDVGYTIIDDVLSLPEKMPGIYRRLTR